MRARNIKPGFFENEDLATLSHCARLLFIGLWCMADREGRLEDRPKKISALLFPYEEIDVNPLLANLASCDNLILRYAVNGKRYIQIQNFSKHQKPHPNESASVLPPCHEPSTILSRATQADVMNVDVMNEESMPSHSLGFSPKKKTVKKPKVVEYSPDFLTFWEAYPRKDEKGKAWQAWLARLKEGAKPDQLILAARNYAIFVSGKDQSVMKLPATLLGPGHGPGGADPLWQEWQKTGKEDPSGEDWSRYCESDEELNRKYGTPIEV